MPINASFPRPDGPKSLLHFVEAGSPQARPLVLLVGLGMRLEEWPQPWIDHLAQRRRVIRIDNRDAGGSPQYRIIEYRTGKGQLQGQDSGRAAHAAGYTLFDMRDDVLDVLDHLGVTEFDLAGFSMGGLISQLIAAKAGARVGKYVQKVSKLWLRHSQSQKDALRRIARLFVAPSDDAALRQILIEDAVYYSAGTLTKTDELAAEIETVVTAGYSYGGASRHGLAVLGTPNRTDQLKSIKAQTLVLHGDADPCIDPRRGQRAAELIPNAELELLSGVGHILDDDMLNLAAEFLLSAGLKEN